MLKDHLAIVTGAGNPRGIGYATARRFAEQGARVALCDLDAAGVEAAARSLGERAIGQVLDVRDEAACKAAVAALHQRFGRVDVLVNNAGVAQPRKVVEISRADYDLTMDVNLRGTLHMSQAVIPFMRPGAAIVCIASIAAQRGGGLLGGPHYAASKGGVLGLVKAMARELGGAGIRVNAINPGVIITAMNATAFDAPTQEKLLQGIPLARFGAPDDVASACLFLASPLSAYITGTALDVNGGMHIH